MPTTDVVAVLEAALERARAGTLTMREGHLVAAVAEAALRRRFGEAGTRTNDLEVLPR